MKKFILVLTILAVWNSAALADTVVVVDQNGYVTQQIYTQPMSGTQQVAVVNPAQTQQVVVTQPVYQPEVVVVRPRPQPRNYYYDSSATAFLGGLAGVAVGSLLFHPHHHHHGGGHHHGGHHHH